MLRVKEGNWERKLGRRCLCVFWFSGSTFVNSNFNLLCQWVVQGNEKMRYLQGDERKRRVDNELPEHDQREKSAEYLGFLG